MDKDFLSLDRHGYRYEYEPEDQDALGVYLYGLSSAQRRDLLLASINDRDGKYCIRLPLRGGGFRNYVVTCHKDKDGIKVVTFKRSGC